MVLFVFKFHMPFISFDTLCAIGAVRMNVSANSTDQLSVRQTETEFILGNIQTVSTTGYTYTYTEQKNKGIILVM